MPKIKISKVVIKWSEGWMGDKKNVEYATVEDAEVELRNISLDKETWDKKHGYKECMGYNKTGIDVYFEDGEIYADARFDVQWGKDDNDTDIRKHIKDFCTFYAGMRRPSHITPEKYVELVGRDADMKKWALGIITKYDLDMPKKEEEKKSVGSTNVGSTTEDIIDKLGGIDGVNKAMKMKYKNMCEAVKGIEERLRTDGFVQIKDSGIWAKMQIGKV